MTTNPVARTLIAGWHDVDDARPVLWYDLAPGDPGCFLAITEPCIYCSKCHIHGAGRDGDGDGHRVAHCGRHTHDLTPAGRRRSIYARGVEICSCHEDRGYVLRKRPVP
jgi:hypothetical protein